VGVTKDQLRRHLHIDEIDPYELLELLFYLIGDCQNLDDRRLVFPAPKTGPARIVLDFTASGGVADAHPGEALTEEHLTEIQTQVRLQLLAPPLPRVARRMLFSTVGTLAQVVGDVHHPRLRTRKSYARAAIGPYDRSAPASAAAAHASETGQRR
jgi:hypothetical protein